MTKQKKTMTTEQYSGGHVKRRRGRPANGLEKAYHYIWQFVLFIRRGMPSTEATRRVASLSRVTPGHVFACRKRIRDAGIREEDFDYRAIPVDPDREDIWD